MFCLVGNTLVFPQGEVGLPGAPGLDGDKVILEQYSIFLARKLNSFFIDLHNDVSQLMAVMNDD